MYKTSEIKLEQILDKMSQENIVFQSLKAYSLETSPSEAEGFVNVSFKTQTNLINALNRTRDAFVIWFDNTNHKKCATKVSKTSEDYKRFIESSNNENVVIQDLSTGLLHVDRNDEVAIVSFLAYNEHFGIPSDKFNALIIWCEKPHFCVACKGFGDVHYLNKAAPKDDRGVVDSKKGLGIARGLKSLVNKVVK